MNIYTPLVILITQLLQDSNGYNLIFAGKLYLFLIQCSKVFASKNYNHDRWHQIQNNAIHQVDFFIQ